MLRFIFVSLVWTFSGAAFADQLFPPENPGDCGPKTYLTWTPGGNVRCEALPGSPAPTTGPIIVGGGSCPEIPGIGCTADSWSFWGVGQPGGCGGGAGIVYTQMGRSTPELMNWPVAYNCVMQ